MKTKQTHEAQVTGAKTTAAKTPSHIAYQVRDTENGEGFWTRIGSQWPHQDGSGFNIQLDCVPLAGRITLRVKSDKAE